MSRNHLTRRLSASLEGSNIGVPQVPDATLDQSTVSDPVDAGHEGDISQIAAQVADLTENLPQQPEGEDDRTVDNEPGELVPEVIGPQPVQQSMEMDGADSTDSLGGSPYATRQELDEHLMIDEAEHKYLQQQIHEVKDLVGIGAEVGEVVESATSFEGIDTSDLSFVNLSLQLATKRGPLPVPNLSASNGRVSAASLESLNQWAGRLKELVKTTFDGLRSTLELSRARSGSTPKLFRARIALIRETLKKTEVLNVTQVTMARDQLKSLVIDDQYSTTLDRDIQTLGDFAAKLAEQSAAVYGKGIEQMHKPLAQLVEARNDEELEAQLKELVKLVPSVDFYQRIESGKTTYLGDVRFVKPLYSSRVSVPGWFSPVLALSEYPGYEVVQNKTTIDKKQNTLPALNKAQALHLLDVIEKVLDDVEKSDVVYQACIKESETYVRATFDELMVKAEAMDRSFFTAQNLRMVDAALMMVANTQFSMYSVQSAVYRFYRDSINAALMYVELSCMGKH